MAIHKTHSLAPLVQFTLSSIATRWERQRWGQGQRDTQQQKGVLTHWWLLGRCSKSPSGGPEFHQMYARPCSLCWKQQPLLSSGLGYSACCGCWCVLVVQIWQVVGILGWPGPAAPAELLDSIVYQSLGDFSIVPLSTYCPSCFAAFW